MAMAGPTKVMEVGALGDPMRDVASVLLETMLVSLVTDIVS